MTCIVGVVDREQRKMWIGGDSAGVDGGFGLNRVAQPKVFRKGPMLMGYTSSFRMGQLLQYKLELPKWDVTVDHEPNDAYEWMVTKFIEAARRCLKNGGYANVKENVDRGGTFICLLDCKVFVVHSDFQAMQVVEDYAAVGSGEDLALGSLHTTDALNMGSVPRIHRALEAATAFSAGVHPPYTVLGLSEDEVRTEAGDTKSMDDAAEFHREWAGIG